MVEIETPCIHREKRKIKRAIITSFSQIKIRIGILLYTAVIHQINSAVKSRQITLESLHLKTLIKFKDLHNRIDKRNTTKVDISLIHNIHHITCQMKNSWHCPMF